MKFREFALFLEKLDSISARNDITQVLADLINASTVGEIDKVLYLAQGTLAPNYRGIVFNVAEKMMIEVISDSYKIDTKEVKEEFKVRGDLGLVSFAHADKHGSDISVDALYQTLVAIANDEGEGSQERKIKELSKILLTLDPVSAKYFTRIPVGKLRLGFSDKTILDALSMALVGDKSLKKKIETVYEYLPDIGLIAKRIKADGIDTTIETINPEVGMPIMPMLAQRLNSPDEMIEKMGEIAVEPKFDGVRVLIHFAKNKDGEKPYVRAFTRNLNDVSPMFPELQKLGEYLNADSVILDSEGVGIDPKTEKIVDFQKTMQRRRKKEIGKASEDIPFRFQLFDIIYVDGKSLMREEYEKRREVLSEVIKKNKLFVVDDYTVTDEAEVIRSLHEKLLSEGLEGVVVKKLHADYVPGRTGWRWVKMKEVEGTTGKLPDTVDCVVMGYTRGKGKRADFGIGQFLAGIKDKEKFKSITKVGTGLTDEQLQTLSKRLEKLVVKERPVEYAEVHTDLVPDFWVRPDVVVELAGDDLTVSTKHKAGYALRFPRLVRFRDDKDVAQTTTIGEVKKLFSLQKTRFLDKFDYV